MACKQTKEKCVTFLWRVENISYCLQNKGMRLESPPFFVDVIGSTKWNLVLYPRGKLDENYIGYFLKRSSDCSVKDKIEIKYELSFLANDGSALSSLTSTAEALSNNVSYGFPRFHERKDVFISNRSTFLPQDTLTARCIIWKSVGELAQDVLFSACTHIGVEKRLIQWNVENFSTLGLEKKCTYQMKSTENGSLLMSIDLSFVTGVFSEKYIRFGLFLQDKNVKFSTFNLSLIDAIGSKLPCHGGEYLFNRLDKSEDFVFCFSREKLLEQKNLYLPNDILSLNWEWTFSKGVVWAETKEVQYGTFSGETEMPNVDHIKNEEKAPPSYNLIGNLKSLYDKQFLCDVNLKTTNSVFPAHKIILSASSAVFSAMFSNEMKEKISDCVYIEDLSDDTISRMLLYIYSAHMEEITWEIATRVYAAADKYAILGLKNICSSYLKENLSTSNACEVLLLFDFHADVDLKETVQHYILKHGKKIVNSNEWKLLIEVNGRIAAETLSLLYK